MQFEKRNHHIVRKYIPGYLEYKHAFALRYAYVLLKIANRKKCLVDDEEIINIRTCLH